MRKQAMKRNREVRDEQGRAANDLRAQARAGEAEARRAEIALQAKREVLPCMPGAPPGSWRTRE
eukprot:6412239-Pyramimonas_sp.AAC.1